MNQNELIAGIQARLDAQDETISQLWSRLADLEHDHNALNRQVDRQDSDIYDLERRVNNAESDINALERSSK